jgi:hypothetical protein
MKMTGCAASRLAFQLAAGFVAVHPRHHDIEQDQVGMHALGDFQRAFAGGGDKGLIALLDHHLAQRAQVFGRIINDQNRGITPRCVTQTSRTHWDRL